MPDKEPQHKLIDTKKMESYGIGVTSGIQLQSRVNKLDELSKIFHAELQGKSPIERMKEIGQKIAKIDTLIQSACLPYLGAGGKHNGHHDPSRPIQGYFTERRLIMEDHTIKMNEMHEVKDIAIQSQIEMRFQIFPFFFFFEDAYFLMQHTFTPEEITPTHDTTQVIHTQPQMGMPFGGTVSPTSGGRTSSEPLPPRRPYPQTLDNRVKCNGEDEEE